MAFRLLVLFQVKDSLAVLTQNLIFSSMSALPSSVHRHSLEQGRKDGLAKAQMAEIEKYVQIALKNLKKYVGIFSIGEPTLNRYKGMLEWLNNKPEKAYKHWRTAIEKANAYPMKYEAARSYLELGRHLEKSNPERVFAFEKASTLFEECGLENWVALVKAEQKG